MSRWVSFQIVLIYLFQCPVAHFNVNMQTLYFIKHCYCYYYLSIFEVFLKFSLLFFLFSPTNLIKWTGGFLEEGIHDTKGFFPSSPAPHFLIFSLFLFSWSLLESFSTYSRSLILPLAVAFSSLNPLLNFSLYGYILTFKKILLFFYCFFSMEIFSYFSS